MTGKIYCISNNINDKLYIGKTTYPTIEERFKEHCIDCKKIKSEVNFQCLTPTLKNKM